MGWFYGFKLHLIVSTLDAVAECLLSLQAFRPPEYLDHPHTCGNAQARVLRSAARRRVARDLLLWTLSYNGFYRLQQGFAMKARV